MGTGGNCLNRNAKDSENSEKKNRQYYNLFPLKSISYSEESKKEISANPVFILKSRIYLISIRM